MSIKIKRPSTGYELFCKDQRSAIKTANPTATFGEMGSLLGKAWKALKDEERKVFEDKAALAKTEFTTQFPDYKRAAPKIKPYVACAAQGKKGPCKGRPMKQVGSNPKYCVHHQEYVAPDVATTVTA